jgi:hypothetical protein
VIGVVATWFTYRWDTARVTTVLLYDLEEDAIARYQYLHDAFDAVAASQGVWHIAAEGRTSDWKRNAGASSTVRRSATRLHKREPQRVRANIEVPAIPVGRQTLHFFPDRFLVFDRGSVGAVSYDALSLRVHDQRFIESERVPSDATQVDSTWKYVNKQGGPDRRFSNNQQLPIMLYEEGHFTSASGLNEVLQVSRQQVLEAFANALGEMRSMSHNAEPPR